MAGRNLKLKERVWVRKVDMAPDLSFHNAAQPEAGVLSNQLQGPGNHSLKLRFTATHDS